MNSPEPYHPNCLNCDLYEEGQPNLVPPCGPKEANMVFVGEAPGADEVRAGKPFDGKAGRELESLFLAVPIMRTKVWITNTILCRPPKNDMKNVGNAVAQCRERLVQEIKSVNPNVVVPMGHWATTTLTQAKPITKWRGSLLEVKL